MEDRFVEQVTPEAALSLLGDGAVLVDVRESEEWLVGRAPQAVHIPLGELEGRLGELPVEGRLVMVCRSGAAPAGRPPPSSAGA